MGSITSDAGNRMCRREMNTPALTSRPVDELVQGKAVSTINLSKASAKMYPSEAKGLDCGMVAEWTSIWASVEH